MKSLQRPLPSLMRQLQPPRRLLLVAPEPDTVHWATLTRAARCWALSAHGLATTLRQVAAERAAEDGAATVLLAPGPEVAWHGSVRHPAHFKRSLPAILEHSWQELLPWDPAECQVLHRIHTLQPMLPHHIEEDAQLLVSIQAIKTAELEAMRTVFREAGFRTVCCTPLALLVERLGGVLAPSAPAIVRETVSGAVQCFRMLPTVHAKNPKQHPRMVVDPATSVTPGTPAATAWALGLSHLQHSPRKPVALLETLHDDHGVTEHTVLGASLHATTLPEPWPVALAMAAVVEETLPTLPHREGPLRFLPLRPAKTHWAAAAALVVYVLLGGLLQFQVASITEELDAVQDKAAVYRTQYDVLEGKIKELASLQALQAAMGEHAASHPPLAELLAAVTALTPKDTWLREFCLEDGTLRVAGEGAAALAYRELLAQQPWVTSATMREAVARAPQSGKERFSLTLQLNPAALAATNATTTTADASARSAATEQP